MLKTLILFFLLVTLPVEATEIYSNKDYKPYTGRFYITGHSTYMIGPLRDKPPWDHMDNPGEKVKPVEGEIRIDVNEKENTGLVIAEVKIPEGNLQIVFDRFEEWVPYQDGGCASRLLEHGNSGNGDTFYPKVWVYLACWGKANVYLNGEPLYKDHEAHFMVVEGMRDDRTYEVKYPTPGLRQDEPDMVDPADMEIDLYVRSKEMNNQNNPPREVFLHFYWEEVRWR